MPLSFSKSNWLNIILPLLIINIFTSIERSHAAASQELPKLFLGPSMKICSVDSPEIYYRNVALLEIYTLHEETKAFFGILMDKLEKSRNDNDDEESAKLDEQWTYIMETIQTSLDSAIHRIRNFWGIIVSIWDTETLPWEDSVKSQVLHEFIAQLEYQYIMVEAIVKAGVKEIVGTLQRQVGNVIKDLESEVAKIDKEDEVTEMGLLEKMDKSLKKMDQSFIAKLLTKIVQRALRDRSVQSPNKPIISKPTKTFLSSSMEQSAIVFQAFRHKGKMYPKFWSEITKIMMKEYSVREISEFFDLYSKDEEKFILNVIAILTSDKQ